MQKFNSEDLLLQLQSTVRSHIAAATRLKQEDPALLLEHPGAGRWSVIQVVQHLNTYGEFYLPAIRKAMQQSAPARPYFKPGWLGNYFTKMISPDAVGNIGKKMKAAPRHCPSFHADAQPVIALFLEQQYALLDLLERARAKDLSGIKTPISIAPFIKLRLGDTFRFLTAHQERHFIQIEHTLQLIRVSANRYPAIHQVA